MRKWMLTCAVVSVAFVFTESSQAQEQIRPANTVITSNQVTTAQPRTGILGRLRNRGQVMTVNQPTTTTTSQTPAVVVQPAPATTRTTTQMQVVETRRGLFGRMRPTRQVVTVEPPVTTKTTQTPMPMPTVQQTQATQPMTTVPNTMPVSEGRQGVLSRLRSRLGR
jgi:adenosylmethionine-8-amino-7-oxononanoate aminotransferase